MATAVRKKAAEAAILPKAQGGQGRAVIRGHSERITASRRQPQQCNQHASHSPTVVLPITHIAAGMHIPIPAPVQRRFGVGEYAIDTELVNDVGTFRQLFLSGLETGYLTEDEVNTAISSHLAGTPEQSLACYEAMNLYMERLATKVSERNKPFIDSLSAKYDFSIENYTDFEFHFTIGKNDRDDHSSDETSPHLVAAEYGLHALMFDVNVLSESYRQHFYQLVSFCSSLGHHATSIDIILDDTASWLTMGHIIESVDDFDMATRERLINAIDNDGQLRAIIEEHFGEGYEDDLCCHPKSIAMYFQGVKVAEEISKNMMPATRDNIISFQKLINVDTEAPAWMRSAIDILVNAYQWDVDKSLVFSEGHIPVDFLLPIGFGLPFENDAFQSLHESSVNDEESCAFAIHLNSDTHRYLANMDICEKLLLFIEDQLAKLYD